LTLIGIIDVSPGVGDAGWWCFGCWNGGNPGNQISGILGAKPSGKQGSSQDEGPVQERR